MDKRAEKCYNLKDRIKRGIKMIANYHTHTPRCGHATGSEREYIEKAISLGFCELGFSEHAPMPFPQGLPEANEKRLLKMRMKLHETDDYVNTLLALREEYKNDIKIFIGFETENYACCFDRFLEFISDYPIDYLILGQHFEEPESPTMQYYGDPTFTSDAKLEAYVNSVIEAVETGKISYIAHPDLPRYRRSLEFYEEQMTRLIKSANAHRVPLEINFYGLQELRNYPTFAFWQIAANIGCDVIFGSDAHKPENLFNETAHKYANQLIRLSPKLHLLDTLTLKPIK